MTEIELQDAAASLARHLGFLVVHFRAARTAQGWATAVSYDGKGYPDLTLIHHGVILFREVKSAKGRLSPDQVMWAERLNEGGHDYAVWRPEQWDDGSVERELKGYASRTG